MHAVLLLLLLGTGNDLRGYVQVDSFYINTEAMMNSGERVQFMDAADLPKLAAVMVAYWWMLEQHHSWTIEQMRSAGLVFNGLVVTGIAGSVRPPVEPRFTVWPSPFRGSIVVHGHGHFALYDASGRVVVGGAVDGTGRFVVNVPSGVYFYQGGKAVCVR